MSDQYGRKHSHVTNPLRIWDPRKWVRNKMGKDMKKKDSCLRCGVCCCSVEYRKENISMMAKKREKTISNLISIK